MKKFNVDEKLLPFEYRIKSKETQNLVTLQLDLTDFCVCKCKGCEHWKWPIKTKLDTAILEKNVFPYLKEFPTLQTIVLSGGEPLLHPDVESIVKKLKQDGYYIGIITSGLGKGNLDWKTLSECCSWIRFSSDGFTNDNYKNTRGVDLFETWTENLKTLMKENKITDCQTRINVTIHEYNIDNFADNLVEFLDKNNLLNLQIYFWLSREIIAQLRQSKKDEKSVEIMKKISKQFYSMHDVLRIDKSNVIRHFISDTQCHYKSCFIPQIFSLISSNGDVFPCCYMYEPVFAIDKQQLFSVIGNINSSTLSKIYSSKKYASIVEQFLNCNKSFPQCKYCDRFDHINARLNNDVKKLPIFL